MSTCMRCRASASLSNAANSLPSWAHPGRANPRSCRSSAASTGRPAAIITSKAPMSPISASPSLRGCAASGWALSFRASTCSPAPVRSRTSRCRCSMRQRTGQAAASRVERARAALSLLGLGDRERNTPGQLSGGQQQRVAIARALINNPAVLLADEPTGNLDTRNSHDIMDTLQSLNRERGVTIIVVTHEIRYRRLCGSRRDDARRQDHIRRTKARREAAAACCRQSHRSRRRIRRHRRKQQLVRPARHPARSGRSD